MIKVKLLSAVLLAGLSVVSVANGAGVTVPAMTGRVALGSPSCLAPVTSISEVQNVCSTTVEWCVPHTISAPGNYDVWSAGYIPPNGFMECVTRLEDGFGTFIGTTGWSFGSSPSGTAIFENGVLPLTIGPGIITPITCCYLSPGARFYSSSASGPIQTATFATATVASSTL
jgi:hypothetical protein